MPPPASSAANGRWAQGCDPSRDLAKKWVYHAHCEGFGDKGTHTYDGFSILRGLGASKIKRSADKMATGVSITIDVPGEFDRIEAADTDRFLAWAASPDGSSLRKQKRA